MIINRKTIVDAIDIRSHIQKAVGINDIFYYVKRTEETLKRYGGVPYSPYTHGFSIIVKINISHVMQIIAKKSFFDFKKFTYTFPSDASLIDTCQHYNEISERMFAIKKTTYVGKTHEDFL